MPNIIQKHPTGITKVEGVIMLKENKIKAFDNNNNDITQPFINKLKENYSKHKEPLETSETAYNFYTQACIPVRYFRYNEKYYIYPFNSIKTKS